MRRASCGMIDARVVLAFAAAALLALAPGAASAQTQPAPSSEPSASPSPAPASAPPPAESPSPSPSPSPTATPTPPPAGVVPAAVNVELAGVVSPAFALARVQAAVAANAQLRANAAALVSGVTIAQPLHPGEVLEAQAFVTLTGNGQWSDVPGTTAVHVAVTPLPPLQPQVLFYSDDPEHVTADGVLYRSPIPIDRTRAARAYVYHVSDAPDRRLYLVLQAAGAARVQVLGATAGPSGDFGFAGHLSTLRYLVEHGTQESYVATLSGGALAIALDTAAMRPNDLVAAVFDLRVLDGDAVTASIVAVTGTTDPLALLAQPEQPDDTHGRRGEFDLTAIPPLALAFAAGGVEPAPFTVGVPVFPNLRAGGRALGGDYGVLRAVSLQLSNPTADPQSIYLYEAPLGGTATTTFRFAGDDQPTSVGCVDPSQTSRYLVRTFALAPGESRTVTGEYMTDGTSSFPLAFGLTGTPPPAPPPTACGHAGMGAAAAVRR
jgi:hypothetical protein